MNLGDLPPELILRILTYLDIPELLQLSRTSHRLRKLATDPQLHLHRIHLAAHQLDVALANRPTRANISPPNAWIWLSKTNVLSRQISKSLIRIRLTHTLELRPSVEVLVARAILPAICTHYSSPVSPVLIQSSKAVERQQLRVGLGKKLDGRPSVTRLASRNIIPEECVTQSVSPGLVATRRKFIREGLKDGLRAWVEGRALQAQKRKADEMDSTERSSVQALLRKIAAKKVALELDEKFDSLSLERKRSQARWGRGREIARGRDERKANLFGVIAHPARAHVLGLKRFWDGMTRTTTSSAG